MKTVKSVLAKKPSSRTLMRMGTDLAAGVNIGLKKSPRGGKRKKSPPHSLAGHIGRALGEHARKPYRAEDHPRAPAGSPGGHGGEFIPKALPRTAAGRAAAAQKKSPRKR